MQGRPASFILYKFRWFMRLIVFWYRRNMFVYIFFNLLFIISGKTALPDTEFQCQLTTTNNRTTTTIIQSFLFEISQRIVKPTAENSSITSRLW